jgi:S1-C subfamily serine protease
VILAVAVGLLIISLLLSAYMIVSISGLKRKVNDERAARASVQDRLTIIEGSLKTVQDDQTSIHGLLDAQAAADPAVIASRVQPSVYTVATETELGSAWVASTDGVTARFVTNYHVIADAWEKGVKTVQVFQDQNVQMTGTIEQALPDIDLAVVDVTANIPALKASKDTPRSGSAVVVIGSPLGLGGSVTTGAVSALREDSGINFIQFSAPISPGNSGGPLVNSAGEVIGITEAKSVAFGAEGIAIAIPVNQVCIRLQIC